MPWFTVDGTHDEVTQKDILENLVKWACANYKGASRIAACK